MQSQIAWPPTFFLQISLPHAFIKTGFEYFDGLKASHKHRKDKFRLRCEQYKQTNKKNEK